jgi:hypothetical protein
MIEAAIKLLKTLLYNKGIRSSRTRDDNFAAEQKSHDLEPKPADPHHLLLPKPTPKPLPHRLPPVRRHKFSDLQHAKPKNDHHKPHTKP